VAPLPQPLFGGIPGSRLVISCWHGWHDAAEEGRVVCLCACPHLPGVWEMQQEPPNDQGRA
jgi:hypothetical protein